MDEKTFRRKERTRKKRKKPGTEAVLQIEKNLVRSAVLQIEKPLAR